MTCYSLVFFFSLGVWDIFRYKNKVYIHESITEQVGNFHGGHCNGNGNDVARMSFPMTWYNASKPARRLGSENPVNSPVDMEIYGKYPMWFIGFSKIIAGSWRFLNHQQ